MRAVLLVLLLLPWAQAQDDAQRAALAPAQVVADAVPGIVAVAIDEARRDGTPDEAQRRAARMTAFLEGLDAPLEVPAGSAAARYDLARALVWAMDVARLTAALPADVGVLERHMAACTSTADPAAPQVRQWLEGGRLAAQRLAVYRQGLEAAADDAPPGIDASPLRQAAGAVQRLESLDGRQARQCIEQAAVLTGVPVEVPMTLRLVPDSIWPTGAVLAIGNAPAPPAVRAFATTWNVTWIDGAYRARIEVPADAPIGPHAVVAGETANASLEVIQAPAAMVLRAPARATPGQEFSVVAVHRTPAPRLVSGDVVWSAAGQEVGRAGLVGGEAEHTFRLDEPGVLRITARHPGNDRLEASEATVTVPVSVAAAQAPPADDPWQVPALPAAAWWALLAAAALIVLVLLVRHMPRPRRRLAPAATAVRPPPPLPSGGLLGAMASFMAWLRHLGRARPGTTVREAARDEQALAPWVVPFEQVRYGPRRTAPGPRGPAAADPAGADPRQAAPMLRRIVERLRGAP